MSTENLGTPLEYLLRKHLSFIFLAIDILLLSCLTTAGGLVSDMWLKFFVEAVVALNCPLSSLFRCAVCDEVAKPSGTFSPPTLFERN